MSKSNEAKIISTEEYAAKFEMNRTQIAFLIEIFSKRSSLNFPDLFYIRLTDEKVIKFNISILKSTFGTTLSTLIVVHFESAGNRPSVHCKVALMNTASMRFTRECIATHQTDTKVVCFSLDSVISRHLGLLINDTLKVCFEINGFANEANCALPNNHYQHNSASKVLQDYDSLLGNAKFADVVLVVGKGRAKKDFHAHKDIFAARSPVFGAMFEHKNTKEALENRVVITDVSSDVFEQFLRYIYTGNVTELDKYALDLLIVADKYQMDCLKRLCSQYLSSTLTTEFVSSILVLADRHNAAELKSNCVDYIADHAEQVMATEKFAKHIKNKPELLFELFQNQSVQEGMSDNHDVLVNY